MAEFDRSLSRRRLMALLASAAFALSSFAPVRAAESRFTRNRRQTVYLLDPYAGSPGANCASCNACRNHALHKRFATYNAADQNRAHPHCRCTVRSIEITRTEFHQLFEPLHGGKLSRNIADLRTLPELGTRNSELGTRLSRLSEDAGSRG